MVATRLLATHTGTASVCGRTHAVDPGIEQKRGCRIYQGRGVGLSAPRNGRSGGAARWPRAPDGKDCARSGRERDHAPPPGAGRRTSAADGESLEAEPRSFGADRSLTAAGHSSFRADDRAVGAADWLIRADDSLTAADRSLICADRPIVPRVPRVVCRRAFGSTSTPRVVSRRAFGDLCRAFADWCRPFADCRSRFADSRRPFGDHSGTLSRFAQTPRRR